MQDVAAERAVLAGIYRYGIDAYIDVEGILNAESFTFDAHQILFKIFGKALKANPDCKIDIAVVMSGSNAEGLPQYFERPNESKVLRGIMNMQVEQENVRNMAKTLRRLEIIRGISERLDRTKEKLLELTGTESIGQIIGTSESAISEYIASLSESGQMGPESIGTGINDYYTFLLNKDGTQAGIPSGFPTWDAAIGGGLRRGTVNIIGARNKVGKSVFGDNVALHVAGNLGLPVLNLDTEMSKEDHLNRMLANLSKVSINDIERGEFKNKMADQEKVKLAVEALASMRYDYISIAGQEFEETLAIMNRWIAKKVGFQPDGTAKPCLIVYDYLKLMSGNAMSNKNMAEHQIIGFQISALHDFMNKHKAPCLSFVQLNRDGINIEDTSAISQSDRIAWLASNVSIFKPKTKEEIAEDIPFTEKNKRYNRKLIPIATRHGPGIEDGDYINMYMDKPYAIISEGPCRNELHEGEENAESGEVDF